MSIISAGGVVYRNNNDNKIEVKLITTKAWKYSLPKGRVEQNDSVEDTAIREVYEEAGVEAKIEKFLGTAEWKIKNNDTKTVYIYLMKLIKDGEFSDPDNEILKTEWKLLEDAISLVEFPPMKKMLIRAMEILNAKNNNLCTHCFKRNAILLEWCKDCLGDAQKYLEKKYFKKLMKNG